jgi:DNA-binding CsgD family transcriptional regulator
MQPDGPLSPREVEIAQAYAQGATYQAIARRPFIAPSTVRTHLAAIYRKLAVSSKLELRARLEGQARAETQVDHCAVISELALSLEEAIARERALSEVLRIISRSGGDIEAVMASILGFALELCEAEFGVLMPHHGDGRFEAGFSLGLPAPFRDWFAAKGVFRVDPRTGLGRMAQVHEVVNILDVRAEAVEETADGLRQATLSLGGARSFVAIPMLAGKRLVGAFTIYRQQVRPFGAEALGLAQSFADQSVIALENARMFSALKVDGGR